MKRLFIFVGLSALPLLFAAAPAPFDYYILSLSWAPEFCAQPGQAGRNPLECAPGKGFIVHGLWPEVNAGRNPESCGSPTKVSKGLVNDLLGTIPSPELIQYEWTTHGTCTGLSQGDYFTHLLLARAAVQIPVQISSLGQSTRESPAEIEAQFAKANPSFPGGAFKTACRAGALTEVRVCFDKDLKARVCTASAGECNSVSVTIRPRR